MQLLKLYFKKPQPLKLFSCIKTVIFVTNTRTPKTPKEELNVSVHCHLVVDTRLLVYRTPEPCTCDPNKSPPEEKGGQFSLNYFDQRLLNG